MLDFYVNSSIHVALAVYSLVRITETYFGLSYNESLDFFVFFGTITGYNFVKYAGVAKLHHHSLTTHLKVIQIFSLICFVVFMYYAVQLSIQTLVFLTPLGLLTLLYAVPFLGGFQKNLRSISYIKVVVVAFVWAGITVLLPLHDIGHDCFGEKGMLVFLQRFLFVFTLILPFDIRDAKYDAITLQTIPIKIGINNTKVLGGTLLIICVLLEFLITQDFQFGKAFLATILLFFILLINANENQPKYYSSLIVEAIPIVWFIFLSVL
ncbi:hypothetical protein [uncultured Tenacibaculum sp.]|uniref:hypothetical protein n=1 Tax=uncultured Tenacibaculum sp. TaxID=174713 RepID=UPI00262107FB|nr:hypothetical protein [uncultured Tenacibaculum sp.]